MLLRQGSLWGGKMEGRVEGSGWKKEAGGL